MPLQAVRKRVQPFQAIPKGPKPTSFFPSRSSHAKTNFLYSKPFQEGQNRLLKFQAIPDRPKPTSACLNHSSRAKTYLFHSNPSGQGKIDFFPSKPFQSGKNRLPHFKPF
jgi:hypothetical protein